MSIIPLNFCKVLFAKVSFLCLYYLRFLNMKYNSQFFIYLATYFYLVLYMVLAMLGKQFATDLCSLINYFKNTFAHTKTRNSQLYHLYLLSVFLSFTLNLPFKYALIPLPRQTTHLRKDHSFTGIIIERGKTTTTHMPQEGKMIPESREGILQNE